MMRPRRPRARHPTEGPRSGRWSERPPAPSGPWLRNDAWHRNRDPRRRSGASCPRAILEAIRDRRSPEPPPPERPETKKNDNTIRYA